MEYEYYYNDLPGQGLTRNNLIYTSLISKDKNVFVKWYYNDTGYHQGKNQVIEPLLMDEKWERELKYITKMANFFPEHVPKILDIDMKNRKIFLQVEGKDFWNLAEGQIPNYYKILPDWQDQMLDIIKAHKQLSLHKYSMHPSRYFIVSGKLKSINYFFTYSKFEKNISISQVQSHIHVNRQEKIKKYLEFLNIDWNKSQPWSKMDMLCWHAFQDCYDKSFIDKALSV